MVPLIQAVEDKKIEKKKKFHLTVNICSELYRVKSRRDQKMKKENYNKQENKQKEKHILDMVVFGVSLLEILCKIL